MEWMGLAGGTTLSARWLGAEKARAGAPLTESFTTAIADVPAAQTGQTRWATSAQRKIQQTKDVTWLTHEPLDFVRRRGDHFVDEPPRYAQMIDPDNIKRMSPSI
jgi:hypothetical protein